MQISVHTMETCGHNVELDDKKEKRKLFELEMSSLNFKIRKTCFPCPKLVFSDVVNESHTNIHEKNAVTLRVFYSSIIWKKKMYVYLKRTTLTVIFSLAIR